MVLPGNSEPLLGTIPLADMDVLFHPQRQEAVVLLHNCQIAFVFFRQRSRLVKKNDLVICKMIFDKSMLLVVGHLIGLFYFNFYLFEVVVGPQKIKQLHLSIGRAEE